MEKGNSQLPLEYDRVDPDEIIARLKRILDFIIKSKGDKKYEQKF